MKTRDGIDRKLWFWLTSSQFRRCWRRFGRRFVQHPHLGNNVAVIAFEIESVDAFLWGYGPDSADENGPSFDVDIEKVRQLDSVCHIKLTSDPLDGDSASIVERELHIFGAPTLSEPVLVAPAYTAR